MQSFTVSELNLAITQIFQDNFSQPINVEGEISNFSKSSAEHWYFTLKEQNAQIRAVMFRGANNSVATIPKDGDKVQVIANVSLYQERGDCQLICQFLSPLGLGKILVLLEERKKKLTIEGLFDSARKKPMPALPQRIGIVTSSTAAALQDMCRIFQERHVPAHIFIFPCVVQGESAGQDIVKSIVQANNYTTHDQRQLDVIIVARGGGSTEDLLAFSDEIVVRAIATSHIPIISGVGHEIDNPLSDLVADIRTPTPTAAASCICDTIQNTINYIYTMQDTITKISNQKLLDIKNLIQHYSPLSLLDTLTRHANQLRQRVDINTESITQQMLFQFSKIQQRVLSIKEKLEVSSPDAIMKRGFALIHDKRHNLVTHAKSLNTGEKIQLTLQDGTKYAIIK